MLMSYSVARALGRAVGGSEDLLNLDTLPMAAHLKREQTTGIWSLQDWQNLNFMLGGNGEQQETQNQLWKSLRPL